MSEVSTAIEDFASEVSTFLDRHASPRPDVAFKWGQGSDDRSVFVEIDPAAERTELAQAKRFRAARYDAGLGWITGPQGIRRP